MLLLFGLDAIDVQTGSSVVQAASAAIILLLTGVTLKHAKRTIEANQKMLELTGKMADANTRMAKDAEESKQLLALPAVDLSLRSPDGNDDDKEREFEIDVTNHGLGPAVYLKVRWIGIRDHEEGYCELLHSPSEYTLGPGKTITLRLRTWWMRPSRRRPGAKPWEGGSGVAVLGRIRVRYEDVLGRPGFVNMALWMQNPRGPTRLTLVNEDEHTYQIPGLSELEFETVTEG